MFKIFSTDIVEYIFKMQRLEADGAVYIYIYIYIYISLGGKRLSDYEFRENRDSERFTYISVRAVDKFCLIWLKVGMRFAHTSVKHLCI
jgi:hypothetical protein